ncbi:MAG: glycoside hydrolase family 32 protein [Treponema sp.]|jgi:beta-fructofuranosidase|nr:glycoside hydrolase family 32 protein [Treponema sp.]
MSLSLFKENIEKAERYIAQKKNIVKSGKMRQRYHFMPEAGWLNDPNGLVQFRGKYHMFYQYNPYEAFWGQMYWGHAISDDLVHWKYLPIALAPSEPYDDHHLGGCFSGSALVYADKLYLMYTGTSNHGKGFEQTQCLACSSDGIHFEKYEGNPVLKAPDGYDPANFRDPKIWRYENSFYLVCGAKKNNFGQALIFKSSDLKNWSFLNVLAESRGEFGFMWECPDFFPLDNKYVLMFSPMGAGEHKTIYLIGTMNYTTGKFSYTTVGDVDWGFDYYAPQSFLDEKGRRLIIGWANSWDWMPWWKDWGPTYKEGWCGSFGIPREVKLSPDTTLLFSPVHELEKIRKDEHTEENIVLDPAPYVLRAGDGVSYELRLHIDLAATTATKFRLELRVSKDRKTVVSFDLEKAELSIDRNKADGWSRGVSRSSLQLNSSSDLDICLFVDKSSIELFTDNFKTVHSMNIFAEMDQNENYIMPLNGMLYIRSLKSWGLEAVYN